MSGREHILKAVKNADIEDPESLSAVVDALVRVHCEIYKDDYKYFHVINRFTKDLRNLGKEKKPTWIKSSGKRTPYFEKLMMGTAAGIAHALATVCNEKDAYDRLKEILLESGVRTEADFKNYVTKNIRNKTNRVAFAQYELVYMWLTDDFDSEPVEILGLKFEPKTKETVKNEAERMITSLKAGDTLDLLRYWIG